VSRGSRLLTSSFFDTCILAQGLPFQCKKENPHLEVRNAMKSLTLVRLLGLIALLVSLAGIPLYGQGQQPTSQDPAAQSEPSTSQQSAESQPTQIFVGKIAKSKGDVVLKDDAGTAYKLDNTDQAQPFVGKTVKVTGTLDESKKTIHVMNIEPASS
jgi:hypothetical protein